MDKDELGKTYGSTIPCLIQIEKKYFDSGETVINVYIVKLQVLITSPHFY